MIVFTLKEIFYSDLQQIRIFTVFFFFFFFFFFFHTVPRFLCKSQLPVPVPDHDFSNSKPCSIFKLLLMFNDSEQRRKQTICNVHIYFKQR